MLVEWANCHHSEASQRLAYPRAHGKVTSRMLWEFILVVYLVQTLSEYSPTGASESDFELNTPKYEKRCKAIMAHSSKTGVRHGSQAPNSEPKIPSEEKGYSAVMAHCPKTGL